jgi:dihydroxyacetone kinase
MHTGQFDVRAALGAAAAALEGSAGELNYLDSLAGDGDLGVTMSAVARVVNEVVSDSEGAADSEGAPDSETARLLSACGGAIARSAPSTSGTLVATGLLRAAKAVAGRDGTGAGGDVETLARSFAAALEGIQARGKASVGERTLVDGLDAVCASLQESIGAGREPVQALDAAAQAATAAAEATAAMVPRAGRASWVPERARGHPDAGCSMLAIVMRAVAGAAARSAPKPDRAAGCPPAG